MGASSGLKSVYKKYQHEDDGFSWILAREPTVSSNSVEPKMLNVVVNGFKRAKSVVFLNHSTVE